MVSCIGTLCVCRYRPDSAQASLPPTFKSLSVRPSLSDVVRTSMSSSSLEISPRARQTGPPRTPYRATNRRHRTCAPNHRARGGTSPCKHTKQTKIKGGGFQSNPTVSAEWSTEGQLSLLEIDQACTSNSGSSPSPERVTTR